MALWLGRWLWCYGFMFIGAEVRLSLSFSAAQTSLVNLARGGLLDRASGDAYRDLESGLARVGPPGAVPGRSELVVRFADLTVRDGFAVGAMRWEATGPAGGLFPALDADITLTKAGNDATILAVWGVYRPQFGGLEAGLDRVGFRRVAQPAIRTFTRRIGAAITDPAVSSARHAADLTGTRSELAGGLAVVAGSGKHVVMDLGDDLVHELQGLGDLLHSDLMGEAGRGLQGQADAEKAVDHLVQ